MPAAIANIAKGRVNEFARRVNANDPAPSGFVVVALRDTGLETLATLQDYDTLALLLAASNTEITAVGYARIVLTDTDIVDPVVDDGANTQAFDTGDFNFGSLAAGQNVAATVISYAPDTGGADSTFIPCHITIPAAPVATNGELFHFRTPSGWWTAA